MLQGNQWPQVWLPPAVVAAAMTAFVIVVITSGIVRIGEGTGQQLGHPLIGVAGAAGVEPDPASARAIWAPGPIPPQIRLSTC